MYVDLLTELLKYFNYFSYLYFTKINFSIIWLKVKQDKCKTSTLRCSIKNCMKTKSSEISLHGLPNNKTLHDIWIKNCKNHIEHQKTEKIKKTLKICGRHFEKHMFKNPNKKFRLIPSAVPTLFHNIGNTYIIYDFVDKIVYLICISNIDYRVYFTVSQWSQMKMRGLKLNCISTIKEKSRFVLTPF